MLKHIRQLARAVLVDLCLAALFVGGLIHGNEGAANVFLFMVWLRAILMIWTGALCCKTDFSDSPAFLNYEKVRTIATLCGVAWFGMFWLAGLLVMGYSLRGVARDREPKTSQEGKKP